MKTIKLLIFTFLGIVIASCAKDPIANIELTPAHLNQTRWSGTFQDYNHRFDLLHYNSGTAKVGIMFVSKEKAGYSFLWQKWDGEDIKFGITESNFEYSIEGKIITIVLGTSLSGKWFITHFDGNKMILEKGNSGEGAYKATLELTKIQ